MGLSPASISDGGDDIKGGGELLIPTPENSCTVHLDQDHYGSVCGVVEAYEVTCVQVVVDTGRLGLGRYEAGGSVFRTGGGGGGADGMAMETSNSLSGRIM